MEPENQLFEKDNHLPNLHFLGYMLNFQRVKRVKIFRTQSKPSPVNHVENGHTTPVDSPVGRGERGHVKPFMIFTQFIPASSGK